MQTAVTLARRKWTLDEYHRMGELGILPESGVELIYGEVREKNAWGTPRRWTYDDWDRMVYGGVVDEDERLELIDGDLVCMAPVGHLHVYTVDRLTAYLGEYARGRALLRVQSPLQFNTGKGLAPDFTLLRLHEDDYRSRQAGPWDALLVVEVADSSLPRDAAKAADYARGAIPEYWIVDVNRPAVRVHRVPVAGDYTDVSEYGRGETFVSVALGGRHVVVEDLVGPE